MILALYAVVALLNLVAAALPSQPLEWATKPLLMPLLAVWLWRSGVRTRGIIAALAFSTLGDIALLNDGPGWFIAGMAAFLAAHICYITTFLRNGVRPKPLVIAAYAVVLAGGLIWLWQPLGAMAFPMTFYGLALAGTAILTASVNPLAGAGGALFFISDFLIAVNVADALELPGPPIWVMLTYATGQALIAIGWRQYFSIHQRTLAT